MKALSCVVAGIALSAGLSIAQSQMLVRGGAPDIERLAVLLDLDEYQKSEVERVLAEQRQQRIVGSFEEVQAQRQRVQQETREKLALVLTQEQLEKFDLLMEDTQRRVLRVPPE